MSSLSLFSGLALKDVLEDSVLPMFHREHGHEVTATYEPTKVLADLVSAGQRPDVFIGVVGTVRQMADDGVLGDVEPLVLSGIGVAVPADHPRPRIDTVEHLVHTITSARSVAYSRTGASGAHFADLLERLGIAEEVNARAYIMPKGFTGEALLDGRADLAVQQIIELASVEGIQIVGPLPDEAQHHVEGWVGLGSHTGAEPAARAVFDVLRSAPVVSVYQDAGLLRAGR